MSDVLELVITAAMLRTAIRAKLRVGTSRRGMSELIATYTPQGAHTEHKDGVVYRLPVELIPLERRVPFLDALNELPGRRPAVGTTVASLAA